MQEIDKVQTKLRKIVEGAYGLRRRLLLRGLKYVEKDCGSW